MLKKIIAVFVLFVGFTLIVYSQNTTDEKLAAQYFQNGEFGKAADLYKQLYDKAPTPFYYTNLIQSLISAKDFKKAEKVVKRRIKRNKNDLRLSVDLGYIYSSSGNDKKAKKQYFEAI